MKKKIVVKAGFHQRTFCPVAHSIEERLEKIKLVDLEKSRDVACQYENGILSWIVEDLKAGEEKEYLISDEKMRSFPA